MSLISWLDCSSLPTCVWLVKSMSDALPPVYQKKSQWWPDEPSGSEPELVPAGPQADLEASLPRLFCSSVFAIGGCITTRAGCYLISWILWLSYVFFHCELCALPWPVVIVSLGTNAQAEKIPPDQTSCLHFYQLLWECLQVKAAVQSICS